MSSSAPDDDALRRQFYGARDIRSLYPRVTENHLRYLEKWGLIRPAAHTTTERFYTFTDLSTIKQLAAELDRDVPLKKVLRSLLAEHQGQLQLDFHASVSAPAKVVSLPGRTAAQDARSRRQPDRRRQRVSRFPIRRRRWPRSTSSKARGSTTATSGRWRRRRRRTGGRW